MTDMWLVVNLGCGWDSDVAKHREAALEHTKMVKPKMLMGSPETSHVLTASTFVNVATREEKFPNESDRTLDTYDDFVQCTSTRRKVSSALTAGNITQLEVRVSMEVARWMEFGV